MRKIGLFIVMLVGLCYGCKDTLTMKPENSLTYENGLTTPKDFEAMLNGIDLYVKMNSKRDIVGRGHIRKGEYVDEWDLASTEAMERTLDYPTHFLDNVKGTWSLYYQGIVTANVILNYVGEADLSKERYKLYKGQALFYKALFYFEIIRRWGDCILIHDDLKLLPVAKTPWEKVAGYAIELAEEAVELLPEFDQIKDAAGKSVIYKSTPCKGAANALLAHLCAWKAGGQYFAHSDYDVKILWEKAEKACSRIITSGTYTLASTPEEVCAKVLVGGSKESIYETIVRGFWNEGGGIANAGDDYVGYPVLPMWTMDLIEYCRFRIRSVSMIKMFPKGDLRGEAYFYKLDSLSKEPASQGYAFLYKYREHYFHTDVAGELVYDGIDQNRVWWRLADIYLLRAECRARLGGAYLPGAIADLNEIRDRAHAKSYDASEYNGDLRYTIFKEREKELIAEGQRYWDVLRNGYVRTELDGNFETATDQDFKDGILFLMISESAFEGNPLLRQNAYWFRKF